MIGFKARVIERCQSPNGASPGRSHRTVPVIERCQSSKRYAVWLHLSLKPFSSAVGAMGGRGKRESRTVPYLAPPSYNKKEIAQEDRGTLDRPCWLHPAWSEAGSRKQAPDPRDGPGLHLHLHLHLSLALSLCLSLPRDQGDGTLGRPL